MRLRFYWVVILLYIHQEALSQHFDEDSWRYAASYLKEAMNDQIPPCDDFYEHVCGTYGSSNETKYESTLHGKASAVASVLVKAISEIDVNRNSTPDYQRAVKVFYDQCTSIAVNTTWSSQLYNAMAKRIGELPLFAKVRKLKAKSKAAPFDPWALMGQMHREFDEFVVVRATIDIADAKCQKRPEIKLDPVLPSEEELAVALNRTELRSKVFHLAHRIGLNSSDLDPLLDPWLTDFEEFYNDWKNVTTESGSAERIALADLSKRIPSFNWRSYLRGLLPDHVRKRFEADLSNQILVGNKELMEGLGRLFNRHKEESIKSFAFMKVVYSIQEEYFGRMRDEDTAHLFAATRNPQERCLEYAVSNSFSVSAETMTVTPLAREGCMVELVARSSSASSPRQSYL